MKRFFAAVLAAAMLMLAPAAVRAAGAADKEDTVITIYHTNDVHGRVDPSFSGTYDAPIGIDTIAAVHADTENSLLVDAGDAVHGTPLAILTKGAKIIELMNAAGYDFMAVGNHEFNYGYEQLKTLASLAQFPIAASNVRSADGYDLDTVKIFTVAGVKIGMFGLSTEDTAASAMPANIAGLTFEDAAETAARKVAELKQAGAEIIVAVGHLGDITGRNGTTSAELVEKVDGIDVFVDGHSHSRYDTGITVGDTLIVSANQYENFLGKVEITVSGGEVVSKTARLLTAEDIEEMTFSAEAAAKKTEIGNLIAEIDAEFEVLLNEKVAESGVTLSADRAPGVRTMQTDLGYLVAEAYRSVMGADIGIANGGDIRSDIKAGDVTYRDIIMTLPFFNALQSKEITPAVLWEVLENGVSQIKADGAGNIDAEASASGRFPQISGFSFAYNPAAEAGSRILSVVLDDGTVLDKNDTETKLLLAASEYVMSGGDDYTMLADIPVYKEFGFTAEQSLIDFLRNNEVTGAFFAANNKNRIVASVPQDSEPDNPETDGIFAAGTAAVVCMAAAATILARRKRT